MNRRLSQVIASAGLFAALNRVLRRPIDGKARHRVGVVAKPPDRERAVRHQREAFVPGSIHGGANELSADPVPGQGIGHLGVHEHQPSSHSAVDELGLEAVLNQGESVVGRVIDDSARRDRHQVSSRPPAQVTPQV